MLDDAPGSNVGVAYRSLPAPAQAHVLAAMQKIVPGLGRISVESFDRFLLLKFDQRQRGGHDARFSASEMSEGALRALGILVAAQQMTPDELLIIEEPDVSIHVGAAQLLFDVLEQASRRGAVLVTTHSADLLDAARDEQILVCSYHDGVTKIGPLAQAQREIVREGLFSVAELMRSEGGGCGARRPLRQDAARASLCRQVGSGLPQGTSYTSNRHSMSPLYTVSTLSARRRMARSMAGVPARIATRQPRSRAKAWAMSR